MLTANCSLPQPRRPMSQCWSRPWASRRSCRTKGKPRPGTEKRRSRHSRAVRPPGTRPGRAGETGRTPGSWPGWPQPPANRRWRPPGPGSRSGRSGGRAPGKGWPAPGNPGSGRPGATAAFPPPGFSPRAASKGSCTKACWISAGPAAISCQRRQEKGWGRAATVCTPGLTS